MAKFDQMFHDTGIKKAEPHPKRETKWIHYTKLVDNQAQYCDEKSSSEIETLADLIEADQEVLQNLLVRKVDTDEFEIIAGHKRRRACRLLVEERGKKQYEFLPCTVKNINDVRAEFQVYSSNGFHEKDDYEKLHELERMKYLLETYPGEFPHLQSGRMVERLAAQMGMKRTTVGEYLTISNKLGQKGREEFEKGSLKKSAAVEISALPEQEQEELIEQGITSYTDIKSYKNCKNEEKEKDCPEPEQENQQNVWEEKQNPDPNHQLKGQYKVTNTDMDIGEEDVPKSGTEEPPENGVKSSTKDSEEPETEKITLERLVLEFGENRPSELREIIKICEEKEKNAERAKAVQEYISPYGARGGTAGVIFYDFYAYSKGVKFQLGKEKQVITYIQFVNILEDLYGPWNMPEEPSQKVESTHIEEESCQTPEHMITSAHTEVSAVEYTPGFFLEEQKEKLNDMISSKEKGNTVPDKLLERQKTIVCALASMVCELEQMERKEQAGLSVQPELPELKNEEQRKEWLNNYQAWGIWYQDDHIGAVYYKYDFPDGTRLIAETYQQNGHTPFMHLVGGPQKREKDSYGISKYPHHKQYSRHPDSETVLVEFLKAIQKK